MSVVSGHIPHFVYQRERNPRPLFTIIRQPVERAISNMRCILSELGHYAHAYVTANRLTKRTIISTVGHTKDDSLFSLRMRLQ